jgi:hypothetical protein
VRTSVPSSELPTAAHSDALGHETPKSELADEPEGSGLLSTDHAEPCQRATSVALTPERETEPAATHSLAELHDTS